MNDVIQVDAKDFNEDLFNRLHLFLKGTEGLEITIAIQEKKPAGFLRSETREQYFERLLSAIKNMEERKNIVSFTGQDFESFTQQLLNEG